MAQISSDEIENLKKIVEQIKEIINKDSTLKRKLSLDKKVRGVLGEAIGLIKIYEKNGDSWDYSWHGGRKRGFDIELTKDTEKKRFEIKTSSEDGFGLRPLNIKMNDTEVSKFREEIREAINQNKDPVEFFRKVEDTVNSKEAEFWLFIRLKRNASDDFFLIEKKDFIEILKQGLRRYLKDVHHRDKTHYGIEQVNSIIWHKDMIDLLENYNKWQN